MLPVNEWFESVQGEATFTGTPSVFIRLQGCPVGCGWCDTKHTWEINLTRSTPIHQMMAKTQDIDTFSYMTVDEIVRKLGDYKAQHVVITGGEPCMHDLWALTFAIEGMGRSVQVETSGTFPIKVTDGTFVTVSPKLDMPGGREVLDEALDRANEIKYPVGKQADVDKLIERIIPKLDDDAIIWLQPLSQSRSATALCVKAATDNDWLISIQTHKFIGVR